MKGFVCLAILVCAFLALPCSAQYSRTLSTEDYVVVITSNCVEGAVDCDDVDYVGSNRRTGESIRLHGRDVVHYCPGDLGDGTGKTPCHHEGFIFNNGAVTYLVRDSGQLVVWKRIGKQLPDGRWPREYLLREQGKWLHD